MQHVIHVFDSLVVIMINNNKNRFFFFFPCDFDLRNILKFKLKLRGISPNNYRLSQIDGTVTEYLKY